MVRASFGFVLAALAALGAAGPAAAQVDEKAALRQFKAAAKERARTFQSVVKAARGVLLGEVAAFEAELRAGNYSAVLAGGLFDDLDAFQAALRTELTSAVVDVNDDRNDALLALAAGTPLEGVFPIGFYDGDGGVADDFRDGVERSLAKLYASLNRRLDGTERLAEKEAGVGLLIRLRFPGPPNAATSSDEGVSLFTAELAIDTLMSERVLSANSGTLWIGGSLGESPNLQILVFVAGGGAFPPFSSPVTPPRWRVSFSGLPPGNYSFSAIYEAAGGAFVAGSFAIR